MYHLIQWYYALESMYNIAKVAKGEILIYFNEVFDALCKVTPQSKSQASRGACCRPGSLR